MEDQREKNQRIQECNNVIKLKVGGPQELCGFNKKQLYNLQSSFNSIHRFNMFKLRIKKASENYLYFKRITLITSWHESGILHLIIESRHINLNHQKII
jgi:hypothetical protein